MTICPPEMTKYECYYTFMAVWTRFLQKNKHNIREAGTDVIDLFPRVYRNYVKNAMPRGNFSVTTMVNEE